MTPIKTYAAVAAMVLAGMSAPTLFAWAGDPVPDIDVKMGKNHIEAQSGGAQSPPSIVYEQTDNVVISAAKRKETGRLELTGDTVEVLSAAALSGEITGNWGGDEIWESDGASPPREMSLSTGPVSGAFTAPGVTNVQQNAGALSLQQGAVSMAVKLPPGQP